MNCCLMRGGGAALVCAFAANAAYADLTAQDVWSDWRSYMTSAGYEVSGSESQSGDTLTINDVSMSMQLPDNKGTVDLGMPELAFKENGDGTVSVLLPANIPIRFDGVGEDGERIEGVVGYAQSGGSMVVSGSPADMGYNFTAAQIDVGLASLTVDGKPVPPEIARISVSMSNVISSTQMKLTDLRRYSQRMSTDSLSFDFAFDDPDSEDQAIFTGALQGVGFEGSGDIPLEMNTSDMRAMLNSGFGFDGTFTYASGNSNMEGQGDGENFAFNSGSQGGSVKVAMNSDTIEYDVNQRGTQMVITTAEFPVPISIEMALTALKLRIPVAKSEAEQDFALALKLSEFKMPDMLWGMFDPSSVLPREPATIVMDLSGKAKVLADFFDPNVAAALETSDRPPGELNALTINELLVSMVGAKLSGHGDFTFDNNDLETFDGIPRPSGFVDLQLEGGNGLLDKLIQMGFVSDQDAMGARMMMGMLAVPGDAPDTLNSKIEINNQGHVMANGQRIQ